MFIKKLLILLCIPVGMFAQPYYIAPDGDDGTGDGSDGNEWFSAAYAMNQCSAGDTVYAKTGTYNYTDEQTINVSGGYNNHIVLTSEAGHPDSVIFDFFGYDMSGESPQSVNGFLSIDDSFLTFDKITVKRLLKINTNDGRAHAFYFQRCDSINFNRVNIDSIAGRGILGFDCRSANIKNCDFTWCADPQDSDPGNAGTGILWYHSTASASDTVRITGCRGWQNADQAFGLVTGNVAIIDSCWAWDNDLIAEGYTSGSGNGFKTGLGLETDIDTLQVMIRRCISAFNNAYGFGENTGSTTFRTNIHVYNNLFYNNGTYGILSSYYGDGGDNIARYHNNISFGNDNWDMGILESATHSYNSFDQPYNDTEETQWYNSPASVNTSDFIDIPLNAAECTEVLGAERQADGSLPDIGDYFKLSASSDLINAGLIVKDEYGNNLSYNDDAPDLGPFEYTTGIPPQRYTLGGSPLRLNGKTLIIRQ